MVDVDRFQGSYHMLKARIAQELIPYNLNELKEYFARDIESVRRLESIRSIKDLIDCLERRDVLCEYNIDALRKIVDLTDDRALQEAIASYVTPKEVTASVPINQYQVQRLEDEINHSRYISSCITSKNGTALQNSNSDISQIGKKSGETPQALILTEKQRAAIYKLLSREIGTNWRFLGRSLDVGEGTMDAIELQYPSDLSSRIYKLLQQFEENNCDSKNEHASYICRALDSCGRKDLRRKVQNILST